MLTDLDWLKEGERFPPIQEYDRLEMYRANRALFEADHAEVYRKELKRIERVIGTFEDIESFITVLNYQKLMSLKIADLLLGEPPTFKNGTKQDTLDQIIKDSDLINTSYLAAIDVSRFGDGLFYVRVKDGKGYIDITQPAIWYPVVNPDNVREITSHVLAWKTKQGLKVNVHYKGYYNEYLYGFERGTIGKLISSKENIRTGLNDFAIVQVPNVITSDRVTGIDDYTDIDSIVSEIMIRIGQISRILDKHANPGMYGPMSAVETDPVTGESRMKADNYFPQNSKDDPVPGYITWDGQLSANFTAIELLIKQLYNISEMGAAMFGQSTGSQITSADQLKLLMSLSLAKVNRIRMRFDPAIKKTIKLCSQLSGINLENEEITINWSDGLPSNPETEAKIMQIRTGAKATISQQSAIMKLNNTDEDGADKEIEMINDDEFALNPTIIPGFTTGEESEPPKEVK